ncbi:MAG: tetraacyldisaccharide 4'-kinase [Alphaproteobacteria bacterium]|nr:MAG: tetraacyldisaccharide 4'-kinase [Alphaproteobacteria bacterium]
MQAPAFWWRKPGARAALLSPLAAIYGAVAARQFKQPGAHAGAPVICVGNPTVGGAGKTPTAIAIARMLIAAGENPVFLTRGYGGALAGPIIVQPQHTAADVGDEPLLLARIAPTVVARDRVAGARLATAKCASIIVMDDGFQNPSLAKKLSILVIDGTRGIGNGRVIPAGPLRAPLDAQLDRAHAILIVGDVTGAAPLVIAARSRRLPLFHARLTPDPATVAELASTKVLAFAGIGDPVKFFATLAEAGLEAPIRRAFGDHHRYRADEATALLNEAERNRLTLLTTEKDLARMQGDASLATLAARARALPVDLRITEDEDFRSFLLGARR